MLFKADTDEDVGETRIEQETDPDEEDPEEEEKDEDQVPQQQFHERSLKAEGGTAVQNVNDGKTKQV